MSRFGAKGARMNADSRILIASASEAASLERNSASASHSAILACAISAILAFALTMTFSAFCLVSPNALSIIVMLVASAAVSVALMKLSGNKRGELLVLAAILLIALALLAIFNSKMVGGISALAQGFADSIYYITGSYHLPYASVAPQFAILPLAVIAMLVSYICTQVTLRRYAAVSVVLLAALLILVLAGTLAPSAFVAISALAAIAQLAYLMALRDSGASMASVATRVCMAIAIFAIVGGAFAIAFSGKAIQIPGASKMVKSAQLFVTGQSGYALTQGDISMQRAFKQSDRDALKLTIDSSEPQTLYLKGYVGGYYNNGVWEQADAYVTKQFANSAYWLDQSGFATQSQIAMAASALKLDDYKAAAMRIENDGARDNAYLPYSFATSDDVKVSSQPTDPVVSAKSVENITALNTAETGSYIIQEKLSGASGAELDSYLACESVYRDYVYSAYLDVPEGVARVLDETIGEPAKLECDEAKYIALDYLKKNVHYDMTPDSADGIDPIVSFLANSRSGFSAQYASAAVMILRYCGVPARYVEGYYLRYDGSQAGSEIQLTENDAHAWAEYYLDGVGWIPFETTPGYIDDDFYKMSSNAQTVVDDELQGMLDKIQQTAQTWTPSATSSPTEGESTVVPTAHRLGIWGILLTILAILAVLALIAWLWSRRIASKLGKLRDCIYGDDLKRATLVGFSYLALLAEKGFGTKAANTPFVTQAARYEAAGACSAEMFERAAKANDKALFSNSEISDDDRRSVADAVEACIENMREREGKIKGFANKWIFGLHW